MNTVTLDLDRYHQLLEAEEQLKKSQITITVKYGLYDELYFDDDIDKATKEQVIELVGNNLYKKMQHKNDHIDRLYRQKKEAEKREVANGVKSLQFQEKLDKIPLWIRKIFKAI